jgi:hypothetical protein
MAFSVAVASFDWTNATALAGTIAVTGTGFQPKAAIVWATAPNGGTDAVSGGVLYGSLGFASGATERGCVNWVAGDATSSHPTQHGGHATAIVRLTHTNGVDLGRLDLQSFDADGATFVVDQLLNSVGNCRVMVMFLGGADLTNAKFLELSSAGSPGTQDLTGFGFNPECCLFLFQQDNLLGSSVTSHALVTLGACDSNGDEAVLHAYSQTSVNPSNSHSYARAGELMASTLANVIDAQAEFSAYITDGVRINWTDVTASVPFMVLGLRGGSYKLATGTTQTDTVTPIVISGAGFQPRGGLVASAGIAESALDTATDHFQLSIGAFTSTTSRLAMAHMDVDNVTGSSTTTRAKEFDAVYVNLNTSDAVEGLMDVQSVDSGGATFIMDDADPSGAFFWTLMFGDEVTAGGIAPHAHYYRQMRA